MKRILLTLALSASLVATLPAAEPVVVNSASNITVGGVSFGKPADAIANNPRLAPHIQRALEAWASAKDAAHAAKDAAHAAEIAALQTAQQVAIEQVKAEHEAAVALLKAEHATAMSAGAATRDQAVTDLAAKNQRINTVLNGLLTQELRTGDGPKAQLLRLLIAEAAKPEELARLENLQAQKAALQAEIDKLTNP